MAPAGRFINAPGDVVTEMLEGLVEQHPGLVRLDGFPTIKVIIRTDAYGGNHNKVAVISGGGSGHEPAHAGYCGRGMLTAAVCGEVFASPSTAAVLAAIHAVTGDAGCLLIVKNYTGDRLNFGLAAEKAKGAGKRVEIVFVGDDCALPPPRGLTGRRGIAGTVLVHKVAGAVAEAGGSLEEVVAAAQAAAAAVGTVGAASSVCTLPGQPPSERLPPGRMELGLGIHGEPGLEQRELCPVDDVVRLILQRILDKDTGYMDHVKPGDDVVLLVNNLGAATAMELSIAARCAVAELEGSSYGLHVVRVYSGSLMTSLDMVGLSLSVMKVDAMLLQLLDSPTTAPGWPNATAVARNERSTPLPVPPAAVTSDAPSQRPEQLSPAAQRLESTISAAASALIAAEAELNVMDAKVGDGDCGSTLAAGARKVLADLDARYPLESLEDTAAEIALSVSSGMGGSSGVLYDIFWTAVNARLKELGSSSAAHCCAALEAAIAAVSKYGGATAGSRTMLDALIPAAAKLKEGLEAGATAESAFTQAAAAAADGASATQSMLALAGRASYVPEDVLKSTPDPGAVAVAIWMRAAAAAFMKPSGGGCELQHTS
eukprot:jgi/Chlat1/6276/Chrsp44S05867